MRRRNEMMVGLAVVVGLLLATPALAQADFSDFIDQTYPLAATGRVRLDNVNGDVRVEVWDRSEVRVEAVKEASSRELLDALKVEIDARPNEIRIETDYPNQRGFFGDHGRMQVEYTLTVPRGAEIDSIDVVNGSVSISGVSGGVKAESVNGEIETRDVGGAVRLSTVNGGIRPSFTTLEKVREIDLESVNGTIALELPSSASASLRAETVNGSIGNDFGLEVHKHKYVGADLRGEIGGGGLDITIETVNGGIRVNGR
jgi:DUF4097 and DUF4098 domain-containing protein YvlB